MTSNINYKNTLFARSEYWNFICGRAVCNDERTQVSSVVEKRGRDERILRISKH